MTVMGARFRGDGMDMHGKNRFCKFTYLTQHLITISSQPRILFD